MRSTLGIEVIDVRVKRIEFSDEVSESVFNRDAPGACPNGR